MTNRLQKWLVEISVHNERLQKVAGLVYYVRGYKRCSLCEIFLDWHGSTCPCCGLMLRVRPRHQISETANRTKCESALNVYEQRDVSLALKKDKALADN